MPAIKLSACMHDCWSNYCSSNWKNLRRRSSINQFIGSRVRPCTRRARHGMIQQIDLNIIWNKQTKDLGDDHIFFYKKYKSICIRTHTLILLALSLRCLSICPLARHIDLLHACMYANCKTWNDNTSCQSTDWEVSLLSPSSAVTGGALPQTASARRRRTASVSYERRCCILTSRTMNPRGNTREK